MHNTHFLCAVGVKKRVIMNCQDNFFSIFELQTILILKLLRYIVPILFLFCSVAGTAQEKPIKIFVDSSLYRTTNYGWTGEDSVITIWTHFVYAIHFNDEYEIVLFENNFNVVSSEKKSQFIYPRYLKKLKTLSEFRRPLRVHLHSEFKSLVLPLKYIIAYKP